MLERLTGPSSPLRFCRLRTKTPAAMSSTKDSASWTIIRT
jgi:hypothetical protein